VLPENHAARFLWRVLDAIDFSKLEGCYKSTSAGPGRSPFHPRMLVALWVYGLMEGLETAAELARACESRDDFRWLAGGLRPSDQTLLNLLAHGEELDDVFVGALDAMQRRGFIDLSLIAEDGTKLRANASRHSFRSAAEIDKVIDGLSARIAETTKAAEERPDGDGLQRKLRGLEQRLGRAERAAQELRDRAARRAERGDPSDVRSAAKAAQPSATPTSDEATPRLAVIQPTPLTRPRARSLFTRDDFKLDPDQDMLLCPAGEQLRLIGTYPTEDGRGSYKLYGRSDCAACTVRVQCTASQGRGRRVKVPAHTAQATTAASDLDPPPAETPAAEVEQRGDNPSVENAANASRGPVASITEPEAVLMLATSEKRWEPSYNADLSVTRDGIIVSQFLTKKPTDFHSFAPALAKVKTTLGKPEKWVGDGHYGTHANLALADREGVILYASTTSGRPGLSNSSASAPAPQIPAVASPPSTPPARTETKKALFTREDFRIDHERNILICPAERELAYIGTYSDEGRWPFRLYGRADCTDCALKTACTTMSKRRVKIPCTRTGGIADDPPPPVADETVADAEPDLAALVQARDDRMEQEGELMRRFRGSTVEPVNAQLKQHGLGRFHVHGLRRCAAVLTLASLGHNVMKWRAKEDSRQILNRAA
jgi:transposase